MPMNLSYLNAIYLALNGGTISGMINMSSHQINGLSPGGLSRDVLM